MFSGRAQRPAKSSLRKAGSSKSADTGGKHRVDAEIHAAVEGLKNLRTRISDAGRTTHSFGVELRCSAETEAALASGQIDNSLRKRWTNECSVWGSLDVVGLEK